MSANLLPQMPAINDWLIEATKKLAKAGIDTARLDAEILLAHSLATERIFLHSHPEQIICSKSLKMANSYLLERLNRMPITYIVGQKEFYGRNFKVTPAVLIPRPESEEIIGILSEILSIRQAQDFQPLPKSKIQNLSFPPKGGTPPEAVATTLFDIGTGSGTLGITAKLEFPHLDVTLTDISQGALNIATLNAKALAADVKCLKSDLLAQVTSNPDIILANLPYVDKKWVCSPETAYEPKNALYADDNGEKLIKRLIIQASKKLVLNGYLIIEADPRQHESLIEYAREHSFKVLSDTPYVIALKKS